MDPLALIQFSQSAAAWVAIWRLIHLKLAKRFPALLTWLGVLAVSQLVGTVLAQRSHEYFWFYVFLVPTECVAGFLAVRELFALTFIHYPGIRSAGRWAMYTGIFFATAGTFTLVWFFQRTAAFTEASRHLYYLEVLQRSIVFSLVVVIVTILFFLSRYPLHLSRNTYVSSGLFSALFLSSAAQLLIDSLQTHLNSKMVDWSQGIFAFICLATWTALLQPDYASEPAKVSFPSPQEDELLAQLASLNQLLSRTARR